MTKQMKDLTKRGSMKIITSSLISNMDNIYREKPELIEDLESFLQHFRDYAFIKSKFTNDLKTDIQSGRKRILIAGFPGVGKSTIAWFVKEEYIKTDAYLVCYMNLKEYDDVVLNSWTSEVLVKREVEKRLFASFKEYSTRHRISKNRIAEFVLRSCARFEVVDISAKIQNKIEMFFDVEYETKYALRCKRLKEQQEERENWLFDLIANEEKSAIDLFRYIVVNLSYREYLLYLRGEKKDFTGCILVIDNLDTIQSNTVRSCFYEYFRTTMVGNMSDITILMTIRSKNYAKITKSDYSGRGYSSINLTYGDYLSETARIAIERDYDAVEDQTTRNRLINFQCYRQGLAKLSSDLIQSKIIMAHYIAQCVTDPKSKVKIDFDQKQLAEVIHLLELCVGYHRISEALHDLSNFNRRQMMVTVANFLEHIYIDRNLTPENLGTEDERRKFILSSYLYSWIVGQKSLFTEKSYNIVKDLEMWKESGGADFGCMTEHLILSYVLNNSIKYLDAEYNYDCRISGSDIIEALSEIGVSNTKIVKSFEKLCKNVDEFTICGMLESDKDLPNIVQVSDIASRSFWLTPRSRHIVQYSVRKFLFLTSLLNDAGYVYTDSGGVKRFRHYPDNPITRDTLYGVIRFIIDLFEMHMNGLLHIHNNLNREDWLQHYRSRFCVISTALPTKDVVGDLMLNNIIDSHIKFLTNTRDHQYKNDITTTFTINSVLDLYRHIRSVYNSVLKTPSEFSHDSITRLVVSIKQKSEKI